MPETQINLHTLYEKVGEVGAIARDAKHAANNASTKIDALAIVVTQQGNIRSHLERLEKHVSQQDDEIEVLKAEKHRREGAIGLFEWVSKHWPFLGLSTVLIGWIGYANGVFK